MKRVLPLLAALVTATSALSAQDVSKWVPALTAATTSGSVATGTHSVTFILSSDYTGTIMGTAATGATLAQPLTYRCENEHRHGAIAYTVTAGTLWILTER